MTVQHELKTCHTADTIEGESRTHLTFKAKSEGELDRYQPEDGAIVTAACGSVFLGTVDEVDLDTGRFTVELS